MPPYAVRVRTATGWQDIALQGKSVAVYEQPGEPMAAVIGDIWIDTDAPTPAPLASTVVHQGHTWSVAGPLTAVTLPGYFVSLAPGKTGNIIGICAKIISGTSIYARLTKNGTNIDTDRYVTPSKSFWQPFPMPIANQDDIGLVLFNPNASPVGLQFTVFEEHTA